METVEQELESRRSEKKKLIKLLAREVISDDDYREAVASYNAKIETLQQTQHRLASSLNQKFNFEQFKTIQNELEAFLEFSTLTPEMLHLFVNRIEVNEDGTVLVMYRFREPLTIL